MKLLIIDLYGDGESLRVCKDTAGINQIIAEFMKAEDSNEPFDEFMERKRSSAFPHPSPILGTRTRHLRINRG